MSNLSKLSIEARQVLEALCDEFETGWLTGDRPQLEEFVQRLDEDLAIVGLVELIVLDSHYRHLHPVSGDEPTRTHVDGQEPTQAGDESQPVPQFCKPHWQDYVRRFPQLQGVEAPPELAGDSPTPQELNERFRGLRPHAAGGLGRVSIAEDVPFNRMVAVKEMHGRFVTSEQHRERFLREAKITGQLEHPSIVPVYVMGQRENGEPYYVMRMIQGRSLLDAINELKTNTDKAYLTVDRRRLLRRFMDVCQAVEFAHSKGVIHRDIKPDNIMLGDYGETLLVDWGLAKQLGEEERPETTDEATAGNSARTQTGTVMGTPAYMSPEQAAGDAGIGTPSDVYSLGATLFHVLTGGAPKLDVDRLSGREPDFEDFGVPKPLQAICGKSMATRPEDRYASAQALADDLELALADEPVSAYDDPLGTRVRRSLQRHRTLAAVGLAAICLMLMGSIVIASLTQTHAEHLAEKNRQLDKLLTQEKQLRENAEKSERRANVASNYLVSVLRSPDPDRDGRSIKVADVLDQAVKQLDVDLKDDPEMQARLLESIGKTYFVLGMPKEAQALVERAVQLRLQEEGETAPTTLEASFQLAQIYERLNDKRAEELFEKVVCTGRSVLGPEHPDWLQYEQGAAVNQSRRGFPKMAIPRLEMVLIKMRKYRGEDSEETISVRNDLATSYNHAGRYDEAAAHGKVVYEKRLEWYGSDARKTIHSGNNYAQHLLQTSQRQQGVKMLEELLQSGRRALGDDYYMTLIIMSALAECYVKDNDLERGLPLAEEVYRRSSQKYGHDHPRALRAANTLATIRLNQQDYPGAIELFSQLFRMSVEQNGKDHPETLTFANNLASAYRLNKQFDEAILYLKVALAGQRKKLGDGHLATIRSMMNLAATYQNADRTQESIPLLQKAQELASQHLGKDHGMTQTAQSLLGMGYLKLEKYDEAYQSLKSVAETRLRAMPDHWLTFNSVTMVGAVLLKQKKMQEAEPFLLKGYEGLLARESKIPGRAKFYLRDARQRLVDLYEALDQPDKAKVYRQPSR